MRQLKAFAKLMRWQNVVMLALVQWLVVYRFMPIFIDNYLLAFFPFVLLVVGICSIAIGGNLLNDIVDQKTDTINRPKRSQAFQILGIKKVRFLTYFFFIIGNISGIILVFFTSFKVANIFTSTSFLLWLYSYRLKGSFLAGNIVVSLLVAFSILLPGWIVKLNYPLSFNVNPFYLLLTYAGFAFLVNLIREIIKDAEDIIGDYASKHNTMPILVGKKRAKAFIQILISISLSGLVWTYFHFFSGQLFALIYIFGILISVGILIFFKTNKAKTKKEYSILSNWIKIWMTLGVISLFWL